MRKSFAASLLLCSAAPVVQAQQPIHVQDVRWANSTPHVMVPTGPINVMQQHPVNPYVALPVANAEPIEPGVAKGAGKGASRPIAPMAVVPVVGSAPMPMHVTELPVTTLRPIVAVQEVPPIPRIPTDNKYVPPSPNMPARELPHALPPVTVTPLPSSAVPYGVVVQPTPIVTHEMGQPMPFTESVLPYTAKANRVWLNAEMTFWWMKNGPQGDPLVTQGSPTDGLLAGAIGQPGTRVLFGGNDFDHRGFWGVRGEAGLWFDDSRTVGFSVGGFGTQAQTTSYFAADNGTNPAGLYIPAANVAGVPFENRLVLADAALAFAGGVGIRSSSQIWGAEANILCNIHRGSILEVTPFIGFRHISLNEEMSIDTNNTDLLLGTVTNTNDTFRTNARLYGWQLGWQTHLSCGNWTFSATSKVALGYTHNVVRVNGSTVQSGPLAGGPFGSGFFAQGTNSGRYAENSFAVVPEVNARLSYHLGSCLTIYAGYDFLYWNAVARPGNQLNRNLNLTQSPIFGAGALAGPALPNASVRTSDFWLHGISAGFELRY